MVISLLLSMILFKFLEVYLTIESDVRFNSFFFFFFLAICSNSIDSTWGLPGTSLAIIGALVQPSSNRIPNVNSSWYYSIGSAAYSASLGVNAIIAILLAIKIYQFQRIAEQSLTVQKRKVHPVRRIISIFNDSGTLMLGCQIIWLVLFRRNNPAFFLVRGPIVMIYVRRISLPLPPFTCCYLNIYFLIGINTNVDIPANHITIGSNFFKWYQGETEKRSLYCCSLCNLRCFF